MPKILSVLDSTNESAPYVRPVRDGEVLSAVLVISVGIKQKAGNILHIQALVLPSGITTQHPYLLESWLDLKEYGQRVFKETPTECECKACESP